MPYRNGQQGMGSGLQPINVKLYISLHSDTKPRDPPPPPCHNQDQWHTSASWEINKIPWAVVGFTPLLQRAHQCTKDSAQGGSQSHPSGCALEVGRGQRHCWCCTGPLFFPSLITDVLCMAQHPIPIYWHSGHFAPAQSPVCTRRPTKLLWRNVGWSCPWITIWKLVPALTTQRIMHYMSLTQPQEICIFLGQMEKEEWPDPPQNPLVSK